jgi:putative peptidoglycan lipid II flippase
VFSASITQINLLFDTLIASFLSDGSVSWLYYSDRLVEFPLGILGVGLATVILPSLASTHAAENTAAFSRTLDWGLRLALVVGAPATIGLFMLAEPMLSTLFQYDQFTDRDVHQAGLSLKAYSLGLLGYLLIKILVPGFTSRLDMKTPVRYGMVAMAASLLLNVLAVPLAHAGLALATSIGAMLNGLMLLIRLLKDNVYHPNQGWGLFLLRVIASSAAMAWFIRSFVDPAWWHDWHTAARVGHLLEWIALSCVVYFATLALCGTRLRHLMMTNAKISG